MVQKGSELNFPDLFNFFYCFECQKFEPQLLGVYLIFPLIQYLQQIYHINTVLAIKSLVQILN